ncbi:MAG TPA: SIMPL domain-containing protein [Thermoanaerobaculia bacterium]|nr:SIMPL domain-containing protein [Thermoanaerobaculia bacterium]
MKTFLATIFIAAAAFAQPASMPPRPPGFPETVSVTGSGRVTLVPDRFTFNVGVQTMAPAVDAAVNENNERVAKVIAALKAAGAKAEEIQTSGFSIYPQQDYSQQGQPPRLLGYQVNNTITVRKKEIASASKLLQVAIGAGVNTASGLNFEVSDPTRGRDQGLKAAFDDARGKAALLARAAGRALGRVTNITEGTDVTPQPRPMMGRVMAAKAEAVSEVPVESGTQELTFTVSVVFELK